MSYEKIEIGQLVALRQGFAINKKTNHHISDEPTNLHLLRIGDMKDGNFSIFVKNTIPEKFIAKESDIIFTRTGQVGLVFRKQCGVVHNNCFTVTTIDEDILLQEFIYYALQEKSFYEEAVSRATGAAQPDLSHGAFNSIQIYLPPIESQRKITNILNTYDILIENNKKQIKLLEEAAERLYREWFVDLHFPGYEDAKIVNGVPDGWKNRTVGEVIEKPARSKQIMTSNYQKSGLIPIIDQSRDFIAGYTNDAEALVEKDVPVIVFGDHTRVLKYIQFPFAKGADGTQLIISNCDEMPQSLLYCSLVSIDLSNYHYARHFKYLKAEKVLIPTLEIANMFDKFCSEIFEEIQCKRNQIVKLTEARDRLLPKIMNGEVEI